MASTVPKGFRWTQQAADKAAQKFEFIKVGGKAPSKLHLSGADDMWQKHPTMIYSPHARIAGTPEDVHYALTAAGKDATEVKQIIASALTSKNCNEPSFADYFRQEKTAYDQWRESALSRKAASSSHYTLEHLDWLANVLKSAVIVPKTGPAQPQARAALPARRTPAAPTTSRGKTLAERLKALPAGKVLDVSNLKADNGSGVREIPMPQSRKSTKLGVPEQLAIVSSNLESFERAISLLGPSGKSTHSSVISAVRQQAHNRSIVPPPPTCAVPPPPVPAPSVPTPTPMAVPRTSPRKHGTMAALPTIVPAAPPAAPATRVPSMRTALSSTPHRPC